MSKDFFKNSNIELIELDKKQAVLFMEEYELLGNIGLGFINYGLKVDGSILSVVSYGNPCASFNNGTYLSDILKNYKIKILQLCRGATISEAPKGTGSMIISRANKKLYEIYGNILVVAYSDPEIGEVGTIYQASNAIYLGKTDPKNQSNYTVSGEFLSGWMVRKKYGTRSMEKLKEIDPDCKKYPLTSKLIYLFIIASPKIKKNIINKLEWKIKLYPKRKKLNIRPIK